jgi:hypothetical protein
MGCYASSPKIGVAKNTKDTDNNEPMSRRWSTESVKCNPRESFYHEKQDIVLENRG